MSNQQIATKQQQPNANAIEKVLIGGDLSALSDDQRVQYYQRVCDSLGLNPLTQPFQYVKLSGGLKLYATRAASEQLAKINCVSIEFVSEEERRGVYLYRVTAKTPDGRAAPGTGAVSVEGLKGEALCNALMKSETKACRRATLRVCGLGMLDETEVETIPGAATVTVEAAHPAIAPAPQSLAKPTPHQPAPAQPINGHAQPTPKQEAASQPANGATKAEDAHATAIRAAFMAAKEYAVATNRGPCMGHALTALGVVLPDDWQEPRRGDQAVQYCAPLIDTAKALKVKEWAEKELYKWRQNHPEAAEQPAA